MVLEYVLAFRLGRDQVQTTDLRAPLPELLLPVGDHCFGNDNHEITLDFFEFTEESQEANRLNRFAQTL